jgi:hypothetical protein
MRPRIIISIVVILAVIVGGFLWFNYKAEQTRLTEQAAQAERDQADRALEEETALEAERVRAEELAIEAELEAERAREEQIANQAEEPEVVITEQPVPEAAASGTVPAEGVVAADEGLTVVGDEITEDAIVVESTGDAVILEADETATTPRIVGDTQTTGSAVILDSETTEGNEAVTTAAGSEDAMVDVAAAMDPEKLLTPANFDRDGVLALLDNSDRLTDQQRPTLRALVIGASGNAAMVDSAIRAIRTALELPPLE